MLNSLNNIIVSYQFSFLFYYFYSFILIVRLFDIYNTICIKLLKKLKLSFLLIRKVSSKDKPTITYYNLILS